MRWCNVCKCRASETDLHQTYVLVHRVASACAHGSSKMYSCFVSNVASYHYCRAQVQFQERLLRIKQFLRLYTSITLAKLASLLELPMADVRHVLIYMKNRNLANRHDGQTDLTQGRLVAFTDVEFHLDVDVDTG